MKINKPRNAIRGFHILGGGLLSAYVYSPAHKIFEFQLLIKFIVLPALIVSGVWLWKGAWIKKLLRTKKESTQ